MKMMKYGLRSVATLAVATLATACSNDNEAEVKPTGVKQAVTLTAYQPGSETRVGFDSEGNAYWHTGDAIGVWSVGESKFNSFGLSKGEGTATATFNGTVTGGAGQYAVYPYDENHSLSGTTLTYSLPDSYTYTSVDQTFFPDGKDGKSFCMPMYGVISDNKVQFKHLGGVVCLKIDKMPAESGTVTVTEASNKLCGTFTASLTDGTPEIKTAASDTEKSVTFTYSGATTDQPGIFYLPVASGSYNLTVEVASATKSSTISVSVEMVRAKLKAVNVVTDYAYVINGHKFIDLGLPSGTLWAETNIGAKTAYDDGNYYAWGETSTKDSYTSDNYSFTGNSSLEAANDVATTEWGSGCRMPTQSEMIELSDESNCTWTWVGCTNSAGEAINCYKVVSVNNGNIIYLPASGYRNGDYLYDHGSNGGYWSSTLYDVSRACSLYFYSSDHYADSSNGRFYGFSVRPVAELLSEGSAKINDAVWNK